MSILKANRIENLTTTDGGINVNNSGKVGIGTDSPGQHLTIKRTGGQTQVSLISDTTESGAIYFGDTASTNRGVVLYDHGQDSLQLYTAGGEKVRIESGGDVGIGVTNPTKKLHIDSSSDQIRISDGSGGFELRGGNAFKISDDGTERLQIDSSGTLFLGGSSSTHNTIANSNQAAKLELSGGGGGCGVIELYGGSHGGNSKEIHMHTNSEHRVKVAQTGEFTLHPDQYGIGIRSQNVSNSVIEAFFVAHSSTNHNNGTIVYSNYLNGNVANANNSYGQLSDERLKENIVDATSQWDDIKALQVRKYNFRDGNGYETHTQIGLVAQEAETVCPGLVKETPVKEGQTVLDGEGNQLESTKQVVSSVLYMKAVKALQEAMTRIETLETQHASLEARLTALEGGS